MDYAERAEYTSCLQGFQHQRAGTTERTGSDCIARRQYSRFTSTRHLVFYRKGGSRKELGYHLHQSHGGVYIFLIEGEIVVDGEVLKRRDGMGVYDTKSFELETLKDSHILLIEVPM